MVIVWLVNAHTIYLKINTTRIYNGLALLLERWSTVEFNLIRFSLKVGTLLLYLKTDYRGGAARRRSVCCRVYRAHEYLRLLPVSALVDSWTLNTGATSNTPRVGDLNGFNEIYI